MVLLFLQIATAKSSCDYPYPLICGGYSRDEMNVRPLHFRLKVVCKMGGVLSRDYGVYIRLQAHYQETMVLTLENGHNFM